jgi:hypothetical protein
MGQYASVSALNGMYKQIEGEMQDLISPLEIVGQYIKFQAGKKIGSKFVEPIVLTDEHGFSWSTADAGAFALGASVALQTKQAEVQAYQVAMRSSIPYDAIAEGMSSTQAFKKTLSFVSEKALDSATAKREVDMLYGQMSGSDGGVLGIADSSVNASATTTTVTLKDKSWAPGIWVGMENAVIAFLHYDDDAAIHGTAANNVFTVTAVDFANKKFVATGTSTGISALDTALASEDCNIYFYQSVYSTSTTTTAAYLMTPGLWKIITNTGSLFGISASSSSGYAAWGGSSYSAGSGPLTFGKLMVGISKPMGKGRLKGKVVALTSIASFMNLLTDQAALRRYGAERKGVNGFDSLVFLYGSGEVEVVSHPCVKDGDCFIIFPEAWKRIGAREFALGTPGNDSAPFNELADVAATEMRAYGSETVYCSQPNKNAVINTIVPA